MDKRVLIKRIALILAFLAFVFLFIKIYSSIVNDIEKCPGKECVKVQTTCCPCNMGGKEKCVKKSEVEDYRKKLENCSEGLICPAVYNCNIESCNETKGEK